MLDVSLKLFLPLQEGNDYFQRAEKQKRYSHQGDYSKASRTYKKVCAQEKGCDLVQTKFAGSEIARESSTERC